MRPPGTYIVPTLLPTALFANQAMAFAVQADWQKAARIQLEGPTRVPLPAERWQWEPDVGRVWSYFQEMNHEPGPWAIDFEATMNQEPVCLGFWSCHEPMKHRGLCIPFLNQGGSRYWSATDEIVVMGMIREFMLNAHLGKVGHNLAGYDTGIPPFNTRALIKVAWDINVAGIVADTMAMHHVAFAELRHALAFLASMVTDLGPFKLDVWEDDDSDEDVKAKPEWTRILERPDGKTRVYNLKDCFATAVAYNVLSAELA
jgi:hypothetical protein